MISDKPLEVIFQRLILSCYTSVGNCPWLGHKTWGGLEEALVADP